MSWFKKSSTKTAFSWNELSSESQFLQLLEDKKPFAVFKHSTRCSISSMAKSRIERDYDLSEDELSLYYLDLIQFRNISNLIAEKTTVVHQSPQLIVVKNGVVIYHASHNSISVDEVRNAL
jgi:bacillithiol system protein YtxJ